MITSIEVVDLNSLDVNENGEYFGYKLDKVLENEIIIHSPHDIYLVKCTRTESYSVLFFVSKQSGIIVHG